MFLSKKKLVFIYFFIKRSLFSSTFRWYKDAQPLDVSSDEALRHRVQLPNGDLFFLHVSATKKLNVAGVYWCIALNSAGSSRSRNATLSIAYIDSQFLESPRANAKVSAGDSFVLTCTPPQGNPLPSMLWMKDGAKFVNTTTTYTSDVGELYFRSAVPQDSGLYQCIASNIAGTIKSTPSQLIVLGMLILVLKIFF